LLKAALQAIGPQGRKVVSEGVSSGIENFRNPIENFPNPSDKERRSF
jgi:hypothetical protein